MYCGKLLEFHRCPHTYSFRSIETPHPTTVTYLMTSNLIYPIPLTADVIVSSISEQYSEPLRFILHYDKSIHITIQSNLAIPYND